jgi:hypothetical protein
MYTIYTIHTIHTIYTPIHTYTLQYKHFSDGDGLALNVSRPEGEGAVMVIDAFKLALKEHQKEGVQFIWNNVVGSISSAKEGSSGSSGIITVIITVI